MIRIEHHPLGLRLHIGGHRWHHFHFGLAMVGLGLVGAGLIARDLDDFLEWCLK